MRAKGGALSDLGGLFTYMLPRCRSLSHATMRLSSSCSHSSLSFSFAVSFSMSSSSWSTQPTEAGLLSALSALGGSSSMGALAILSSFDISSMSLIFLQGASDHSHYVKAFLLRGREGTGQIRRWGSQKVRKSCARQKKLATQHLLALVDSGRLSCLWSW